MSYDQRERFLSSRRPFTEADHGAVISLSLIDLAPDLFTLSFKLGDLINAVHTHVKRSWSLAMELDHLQIPALSWSLVLFPLPYFCIFGYDVRQRTSPLSGVEAARLVYIKQQSISVLDQSVRIYQDHCIINLCCVLHVSIFFRCEREASSIAVV